MLIPNLIHQIWFGPRRPQELFARVRRYHPRFRYMLWTENKLPFRLYNQKLFDRARYPAERSDLLRYELLYRFGGVYLDADSFVLRSFQPLLTEQPFVSYESEVYQPGLMQNGIMGFPPQHPILWEMIQRIGDLGALRHDISCWQTTGPGLLTQVIEETANAERPHCYPAAVFLPIHHRQLPFCEPRDAVQKANALRSYTLHLWGSVLGYDSSLFRQYLQLAQE